MGTFVDDEDLPTIPEGTTATFNLTVDDGSGNAEDIRGWTITVTVKDDHDDSDANAHIQKTISTHDDPEAGKTSWTFTASETADLNGVKDWDIDITKANGDDLTPNVGVVYFRPTVTD